MKLKQLFRNIFFNGWEEVNDVPKWVLKAWHKAGRSYGPKTWYFKGKTFVYKIFVDTPQFMGHMPTKAYRKLRQ